MSACMFKNLLAEYLFKDPTYLTYIYWQDLVLDNPEGLIYHKTLHTNHVRIDRIWY